MHSFIKVLALLGKSACTFVGKCLHSLYIGHNRVLGYFYDSPEAELRGTVAGVFVIMCYSQSPSSSANSLDIFSLLINVVAMSMLLSISSLRANPISQRLDVPSILISTSFATS